MNITVGTKIQTKKQHPCGCDLWEVARVGADVKIKCEKCGRLVMLSSTDFEKRLKKVLTDVKG